MNSRVVANQVIVSVLSELVPIDAALEMVNTDKLIPKDKALVQEITYGVCRYFHQLDAITEQLINKPFKEKDTDVLTLILIGLYQIEYMRVPSHAAVSETVQAVIDIKKPWAKAVVNAVLRNFIRQRDEIMEKLNSDESAHFSHPAWFIGKIKKYWPEQWQEILEANNQRPPLTLRVNQSKTSRETYLEQLKASDVEASPGEYSSVAIILEKPINVHELPGFEDGLVSVQDEAAQLAATLLDVKTGMRVLDACAAPGGKTCHILEGHNDLKEVVALDVDEKRLEKVKQNLNRLKLSATIVCGDASAPDTWWDGELFDRILLDAPCSATGVIRRHPDIKLLRSPEDVAHIKTLQAQILENLWLLLKPGGQLLYATCSVLPEENEAIIKGFIESHPEAKTQPIAANWGLNQTYGRQILPGEANMDGFYYASLLKDNI